jgi:hypothetical protein
MRSIEDNSDHEITNPLAEGSWRPATRCVPNGNCAEVNRGRSDRIGVRDSKGPVDASTLEFRPAAWTRFLAALKA